MMTDEELRQLVRDAISRHRGEVRTTSTSVSFQMHPSFARFPVAPGGDGEGTCLIEPTVRCNHCGYCQSHGH